MKFSARWMLLGAFVAGTLLAATPASAQPEGSYLDSCRDVQLYHPRQPDGLLLAECRNNRGQWAISSLRYRTCRGDIVNDNGNLTCGDEDVGGDNLPPGNWRATCRNAYFQAPFLYAECRDTSGRWQQTELNLNSCRQSPIANDDGTLVCNRSASTASRLTLYTDADFRGNALQLTGPVPDLRDYDFDNQASSLRVQGAWYVCTDINYRGECSSVSGSFNLKSKWNDKISSARPAQ